MTKQLSDLFQDFTQLSSHEQLEKIREIRHSRSIERPAVARKRKKKEAVKEKKSRSKAEQLFKSLSPEQKAILLEQLKAMENKDGKGSKT